MENLSPRTLTTIYRPALGICILRRLLSGGGVEDVGIIREYVGERCYLPHVMGVSCQQIVPSYLYESVLGMVSFATCSERRSEAESSSPFIRDSGGLADNSPE